MPNYTTLGPLQVFNEGLSFTPSRPLPRQILALLLMESNQVVSTDAITRELWDENPPRSARTTVQTYVHYLRKELGRGDAGQAAREILLTRSPGYLLRIDPADLDATRFSSLVRRGRSEFDSGHYAGAIKHLRDALVMWEGTALADVPRGPLLTAHVVNLEETRLVALELRIEAEMRMGGHRNVVGELRSLVETHPFNERIRAQLITALHESGRRGEALEEYSRARQILRDEFGLEPDHELRSVQRRILTAEVC